MEDYEVQCGIGKWEGRSTLSSGHADKISFSVQAEPQPGAEEVLC